MFSEPNPSECEHITKAIGVAGVECRPHEWRRHNGTGGWVHIAAAVPADVLVHMTAVIFNRAVVGPGSVIARDAVVGFRAVLGECVTIMAGATVRDHAEVDDDAIVGSWAVIDTGAHVGKGATIRDEATVGCGMKVDDGALFPPLKPDPSA